MPWAKVIASTLAAAYQGKGGGMVGAGGGGGGGVERRWLRGSYVALGVVAVGLAIARRLALGL
jgi:hypothetical protein